MTQDQNEGQAEVQRTEETVTERTEQQPDMGGRLGNVTEAVTGQGGETVTERSETHVEETQSLPEGVEPGPHSSDNDSESDQDGSEPVTQLGDSASNQSQ